MGGPWLPWPLLRTATACHQHENVQHHARPAAATLSSSLPTCVIQDRRAGVQGCMTSFLRIWRMIANLCLSLDADNGHQHVPSAANQHTSWRSFIRCCWTLYMEKSANPAERVGHYTRTVSTSTQNASIWSLTAAAPSDSVSCVLCINSLTYLLTYLLTFIQCQV